MQTWGRLGTSVLVGALLASTVSAADIGVIPTKLIVVDKTAVASKAKAVFVAKDAAATKGAGLDVEQISVQLDVAYGNGSAAGAFVVPAGSASGWLANKATVAKYVNKAAPGGPTQAKVAVIKPGKLLKLVGKGLGDTPLDILGAGDPAGAVYTAYCVTNGAEENCHCSTFTGCIYKSIAGGTGAKLVCKSGAGDALCQAASPVCGDGVVEAPETCDPPGTCPVSCDDADACTTDELTGSAGTCDAACTNTPITLCQNGDGCCPAGCGLGNDDDCASCFVDQGLTVLDTCTSLEWEKKDTAVGSGADAANPHAVDNMYSWAGQCTLNTGLRCQPNSTAAATCTAQTGGAVGCGECGGGDGTCDVDPFGAGTITTVWDWINQVNATTFAGHTDWRLATSAGSVSYPTGEPAELESIVDLGFSPTIDPIFGPTEATYYWSASTYSGSPHSAYAVNFSAGNVNHGDKVNHLWVRAVRPAP